MTFGTSCRLCHEAIQVEEHTPPRAMLCAVCKAGIEADERERDQARCLACAKLLEIREAVCDPCRLAAVALIRKQIGGSMLGRALLLALEIPAVRERFFRGQSPTFWALLDRAGRGDC